MKNEQMTIREDKTLLGMLLAVAGNSLFVAIVSVIFSLIITSIMAATTSLTGDALIDKINVFYSKYYIEYFITIVGLSLLLLTYGLLLGKRRTKSILNSFKNKKVWIYSLLIGLGFVIVSSFYSYLISFITEASVNSNQVEVVKIIEENFVLAFIYIVILAPLTEEIGMRYFIFGGLKKHKKVLAYILGSCIFALLHYMVLIGQSNINVLNEVLALPTYLGAGLLFCYVYDKSERISCPIIMHTLNNLISFLIVVL